MEGRPSESVEETPKVAANYILYALGLHCPRAHPSVRHPAVKLTPGFFLLVDLRTIPSIRFER